jgi:hypothetical protein
MPFRLRVFAVLFLTAQLVSCGPDENVTQCQNYSKTDLTGRIEDDILGTWQGCVQTIDTAAPICVFEPDGVFKVIYKRVSEESLERAPDFYEVGHGRVDTYTYIVEGDLISGRNRVYSPDLDLSWKIQAIHQDSLVLFDPDGAWRRLSCSGYGFD